MYRLIAIVSGGLVLAACSSTGDWGFKPEPVLDTIRFESEPPGAEAKTSNGQSCHTPCALALPAGTPFSVTYSLNGYQPDIEQVEMVSMGDGTSKLRPNPVVAELTAAAPPKPKRKVVRRKVVAKKPALRRAPPAAAAEPPPPPMSAAPVQQAPSPWPATPPPPSR